MSEEGADLDPVAFAREGVEAYLACGVEAFRDYWDEDVVLDTRPIGMPGFGVFEGLDAALAFMHEWVGSFEDYEVELERIERVGERGYLAEFRQSGTGTESGVPVEGRFAHLGELTGERATHIRIYGNDIAAARREAGLES
jgi:ketosteroid isomerase-like protein